MEQYKKLLVAGLMLCTGLGASPAVAADDTSERAAIAASPTAVAPAPGTPDASIDAIKSVAPESLEAVVTDDGVVVNNTEGAEEDQFGRSVGDQPLFGPTNPNSEIQVEVPEDPSEGITLGQSGADDLVIGLPSGDRADNADFCRP